VEVAGERMKIRESGQRRSGKESGRIKYRMRKTISGREEDKYWKRKKRRER
jgi:hypothetical protein